MDLADSVAYITLATVLAVFKILPELDERGEPIDLREEYTTGIVRYVCVDLFKFPVQSIEGYYSHPKPFRCRIVPRSAELASLLELETSLD